MTDGERAVYQNMIARGQFDDARRWLEEEAQRRPLGGRELLALTDLRAIAGLGPDVESSYSDLIGHEDVETSVRAAVQLVLRRIKDPDVSLAEIRATLDAALTRVGDNGLLRGIIAHARGKLHLQASDIQSAREQMEESRRLLEEAGATSDLAKVLDSLASFYDFRGDREAALSYYCLSLAGKAQTGDLYGIAITLGNLGRSHLRANAPELALSCLREDLRIATQLGDQRGQVVVRTNMAQALTNLGRLEEAEELLVAARQVAHDNRWLQQEAYALKDLALLALRRGDARKADRLLNSALALLPTVPPSFPRGQVLIARADLASQQEEWERAEADYHAAREIFVALSARREESVALSGLARLAEKRGQFNSCLYFLEKGMRLLKSFDVELVTAFHETLGAASEGARGPTLPQAIGPYRITGRLGGGAFADVYKGFDTRTDATREDVAVKVLRLEGVTDQEDRLRRLSRFRREYEILVRVSHPNVVRLYEFSETSVAHIAQEYVDGGSLAGKFGPRGGLTPEEARPLMAGILTGLRMLHEAGIIHRDLKPGNILMRRADGTAVIVDFGLARVLDLTALTVQSAVMGTLPYMAPEQLRADAVDERVDIYAFGVIFYFGFSGQLPHTGEDVAAIARSIQSHHPTHLRVLCPELVVPLTNCVMRCLEKNPNRRPQSVAELQEELEEAWGG